MTKRGHGLWIAAGVSTLVLIAAILIDPTDFGVEPGPSELDDIIEKAATYYEFDHFDRAAETYRQAAELGMDSGLEWYQYAHSLNESGADAVAAYVNAYQLLLDQAPYHDYFTLTERFLAETAVPFNYSSAEDGSLREGTLLVTVGAVFRVKRGRSATGVDTLFVNTRPHDWFGYLGDPVRIVAPKYRSYQQGETVSAIGWYDGWCDVNDDAGITRRYPCIVAAGVVPAR